MRKYITTFILIGLILITSKNVAAIEIVNTGPGPASLPGWDLDNNQWLAAEFDLNQDYVITDIQGWMNNRFGETLTIVLYGDGGEVPDVSNEILNQRHTMTTSQCCFDWNGLSRLNWALSSGTYWVAFEVRAGDTFHGVMPYYSSSPLINEAFWNDMPGYYRESDGIDTGIKIQGTPIPEPSTMLYNTPQKLDRGIRWMLACQ